MKIVRFQTKMDGIDKIYICKPLRQTGLGGKIEIAPNWKAAVIYKAGTKISDILASIEIIVADLRHQLAVEAEAAK